MVSKVMEHFEILGVTNVVYSHTSGDIWGEVDGNTIKLYEYDGLRCKHFILDLETRGVFVYSSFDEITGYLEVSHYGGMIW